MNADLNEQLITQAQHKEWVKRVTIAFLISTMGVAGVKLTSSYLAKDMVQSVLHDEAAERSGWSDTDSQGPLVMIGESQDPNPIIEPIPNPSQTLSEDGTDVMSIINEISESGIDPDSMVSKVDVIIGGDQIGSDLRSGYVFSLECGAAVLLIPSSPGNDGKSAKVYDSKPLGNSDSPEDRSHNP